MSFVFHRSCKQELDKQEFFPDEPVKKRFLEDANKECEVIEFKIETEKLGNYVMKLMDWFKFELNAYN